MAVLEKIKRPNDVKKLDNAKCETLINEIREKIITTVNTNGGHLASNLGIVETTVALCRVFDFSFDKLLFDVGHQCYPYKLLTGRYDNFSSLRKNGGISGFPDVTESKYDSFIAGHAGNSMGASLGKCFARDKLKKDYYVIDIIGDASLSNGLNLEALTADNVKPKKYIVILNDNGMSISKNTNGFYKFLTNTTISESYVKNKNRIKKILGASFITAFLSKAKNFIKRLFKMNNTFESFGFKYVGIYDGNNLAEMEKILNKVKRYAENGAVLLHIKTKKGKGYLDAEKHADSYHGVGVNMELKNGDFSKAVGEILNKEIEKDKKIFAITAGMASGTGLEIVKKKHSGNFIDVGIAEEYAVNLASGMASEGLKPVVCIYSTFLQRAYDEILHDVCIDNLPVLFLIDRAGLNGNDGKTHQGVFDISFLSHLPNLKIYAPKNVCELKEMIKNGLKEKCPVAIRYPNEKDLIKSETKFDGGWEKLKDGKDITILAVGPRMNSLALSVAKKSKKDVCVINARVIKPIDENSLNKINTSTVITLEENSLISGFSGFIKDYYMAKNNAVKVISYGVKDEFIKNASVSEQLKYLGITEENILKQIEKLN